MAKVRYHGQFLGKISRTNNVGTNPPASMMDFFLNRLQCCSYAKQQLQHERVDLQDLDIYTITLRHKNFAERSRHLEVDDRRDDEDDSGRNNIEVENEPLANLQNHKDTFRSKHNWISPRESNGSLKSQQRSNTSRGTRDTFKSAHMSSSCSNEFESTSFRKLPSDGTATTTCSHPDSDPSNAAADYVKTDSPLQHHSACSNNTHSIFSRCDSDSFPPILLSPTLSPRFNERLSAWV